MPFRILKLWLRITFLVEKEKFLKCSRYGKDIEVDKKLGTLLVNSLAAQTALTQLNILGKDVIIVEEFFSLFDKDAEVSLSHLLFASFCYLLLLMKIILHTVTFRRN